MDSNRPLFGADIGRNVRPIIRRHLRYGRHVAKLPVMGAHAVLDHELKRDISVVRRLVDTAQEWRQTTAYELCSSFSLFLPCPPCPP